LFKKPGDAVQWPMIRSRSRDRHCDRLRWPVAKLGVIADIKRPHAAIVAVWRRVCASTKVRCLAPGTAPETKSKSSGLPLRPRCREPSSSRIRHPSAPAREPTLHPKPAPVRCASSRPGRRHKARAPQAHAAFPRCAPIMQETITSYRRCVVDRAPGGEAQILKGMQSPVDGKQLTCPVPIASAAVPFLVAFRRRGCPLAADGGL